MLNNIIIKLLLFLMLCKVASCAVEALPESQSRQISQFVEQILKPVLSFADYMNRLSNLLPTFNLPRLESKYNSLDVLKLATEYKLGPEYGDNYAPCDELIAKHFKVEVHEVLTEDGYILKVFRIPSNGPPVFLMHGLQGSADDFILAGRESALAYLLAELGYDVWIGNARGNKYCRKHKTYATRDRAFWEFTWHEIGIYDLPAMIDYALNANNRTSLRYVGHSQGTSVFWVMLSERPEYNKKVTLMVALAPVAYVEHIRSPLIRLLAPESSMLYMITKAFGIYELPPVANLLAVWRASMCASSDLSQLMCVTMMFLDSGFDFNQLNVTNLPMMFGHAPSGSSVKQYIHFSQCLRSGRFIQFDHGPQENLKRYGSTDPPTYKLENVKVPVVLFHSEGDWLADTNDVMRLYKQLPNVIEINKMPIDEFNHVDFMYARDVKKLVYERLTQIMASY